MRRIPIRAKVAASLALPLLALMAVSAFEVRQAARELSQLRSETALAGAVSGPAGIINRLQDERNWASLELTGLDSSFEVPVVGYDETRQATDDAVAAFRTDVESKGGVLATTFDDPLGALDRVREIRRDIDQYAAPRSLDNMPYSSQVYDRYTELIQGLLDANSRITGQVRDAELRQGTDLAVLATEQTEIDAALSRQTVTAATLSPNGIDTLEERTTITGLLSKFDRNNERIQGTAGPYAAVVRQRFPAENVERVRTIVTAALDTGTVDVDAYMASIDLPMDERFQGLRDAVIDDVSRRAERLDDRASARRNLFVILVVVTLGVAVAMTWLVSRSITRPMRSLTRQAREMADHRLPGAVRDILETPRGQDVRMAPIQPVEVATRDEVADVVEALNTMQESALKLAAEQAVLRRHIGDSFVNLGRRNQNLLGRQLDFITELESDETDPDTLAGLFRLDHLATRMRRNAESLLVLAGIDPPRKWTVPVKITDVVRAALGEVEDYQRVRVDHVDPAMILGSVAADLAHLLAELVENSLTFSPPTEDVVVWGRWWDDGDGYRLSVVDEGLGMAVDAISVANARLAGSESMTVAPSKFLGHHVAGSLAARHGIHVRLDPGAFRGVVATVDLPRRLIETSSPDAVTGPGPAPSPPAAAGPLSPPIPVTDPDRAPVPAGAAPPWRPAAATLAPPTREVPPLPAHLVAALEAQTRAIEHRPAIGASSALLAPGDPPSASGGGPAVAGTLPRRQRGAQLPTSQPTRLRPYGEQDSRQWEAASWGEGRRGGAGRANHVYSFLTGFSSGVRRGRDEVQRQAEEPPA